MSREVSRGKEIFARLTTRWRDPQRRILHDPYAKKIFAQGLRVSQDFSPRLGLTDPVEISHVGILIGLEFIEGDRALRRRSDDPDNAVDDAWLVRTGLLHKDTVRSEALYVALVPRTKDEIAVTGP